MAKVVVRLKGGLGNQLFCYAAGRRLAFVNNAELVIDHLTGFARDRDYGRQYALDHFCIGARKATAAERLQPFERCRRAVIKRLSARKPFEERRYIEQEGCDFDERLLAVKVAGVLYLDGLWQSEGYFKDVEQTIRADLRINPPTDAKNERLARRISDLNAVAMHVRWFDVSSSTTTPYNLPLDYYRRSISLMESRLSAPHYIVFSDDPDAARAKLTLPQARAIFVSHNSQNGKAYADLWLMTRCRHFITANSTFSWWGAWLGGGEDKIVVTPSLRIDGVAAWGFKGLIPKNWVMM